ncbi:MAG: Polymyxin resistance protein ArnA UDP-4-amino-4-deoxy-L-arabinose formylase, partial [Pseudomonadota bacterium]
MTAASPASAVVFAYHNVGVRGLLTLLDAGVDVRMVVTHEDNPQETLWF